MGLEINGQDTEAVRPEEVLNKAPNSPNHKKCTMKRHEKKATFVSGEKTNNRI